MVVITGHDEMMPHIVSVDMWSNSLSCCCAGWLLHIHPTDAHPGADPGAHPEPADGLHPALQSVFQTVRTHHYHCCSPLIHPLSDVSISDAHVGHPSSIHIDAIL